MLHGSQPRRSHHLLTLFACVALCAASAASSGCYKRVVKAEGIGAEGVAVQNSNRSNSLVDRAVFGSETKSNPRRPSGYTPRD
ncbi:MAG: hypothetical protein KF912_00380 [Phycisphaeraceae bacterium]|nr:hypothetical protein [Phycisphaeraceae bacterium]MBX3365754.1 hypothetical protein [Phycisphaeraceae bacterium]